MDLSTLPARLDELEQEYQQRNAPLNRLLDEKMEQVNKPGGLTPDECDRQIRAILEQVGAGEGPLHALLDELCPAYLRATPVERETIRAAVAARRSMPDRVRNYGGARAMTIHSADDVDVLHAALAAISIENCASDYRDTLLALSDIYGRADRAGMDPQPYFDHVAALSGTEKPRGGRTPVAQVLREFQNYAVCPGRQGRNQLPKVT